MLVALALAGVAAALLVAWRLQWLPQGSARIQTLNVLVTAAALTYGANVGAATLSLVNVLIVARTLGPRGAGTWPFSSPLPR